MTYYQRGEAVLDLEATSLRNPNARLYIWEGLDGVTWKWSKRMKLWTHWSAQFQVWSGFLRPIQEFGPYKVVILNDGKIAPD